MTEVVLLDGGTEASWRDYVLAHPEANLYHSLEWREVIRSVFGHRPLYFLARDGRMPTGILPAFLVRFPGLGSKLVSLPYDIGSGGALAEDWQTEKALVERVVEMGRELQVNHVELRFGRRRPHLGDMGLEIHEPVVVSEMSLTDEEEVWARIDKGHRKAVRKAKRRGVEIREARCLADVEDFYRVYLDAFHRFGTPAYSARYFREVWSRLQPLGAARLLLAVHEERCLGGLLLYCWQKNSVSKFAACDPSGVPLRAFPALYWAAIQLALEAGIERLSWGTASLGQTGLIEFKERWGAESRPAALYQQGIRRSVPDISSYYDSDAWPQRAWRRLPLSVTKWLGPPINRWFC